MPNLLNSIYKEVLYQQSSFLSDSYNKCKQITKAHAKSFYLASQFLPKKKRHATYVLYGFCRYTDNIVDENLEEGVEAKKDRLRKWSLELSSALANGKSMHPILHAFAHLCKDYPIKEKHAFELIRGVQMDLEKNTYESYSDLKLYCYRVASTVGLMMSEILGYKSKDALPYAVKLGEAMQITNILRDIKEDYETGRLYLPNTLMKGYGVSQDDIKNGNVTLGFRKMVEFLATKADALYQEAEIGIEMLDYRTRFSIIAASKTYQGILKQIRRSDYDVFSKRHYVPWQKKIAMLVFEYLKTPFRKY